MYFVYGQENKILDKFEFKDLLKNSKVNYHRYDSISDDEKCKLLKRRLRNAIAHCRFYIEIRNKSGIIERDGDVWFIFNDENRTGNDKIIFEMSFPTFGNLVENAGAFTMNYLKRNTL